ncbi:hypothetical protein SAMN05421805_10154 [Saccharopolyspora antimicrobica]|uniref:DUF2637 domain-containing protein n=1 Tax=Saccharopolyspora antimicrobica TaxID=455193 RepID=A0A1I4QCC6_9PSEU|nr:hypothetical protein [Saccharopolyspora antimicrobica]RKT84861.1 hypothetical protein ATL45_3192 [Saccharopolyspora antimicrobica]SFM37446.1 hypothetical protein SAMN05421805_10154 [Saccharopolyspora antimicrobica]
MTTIYDPRAARQIAKAEAAKTNAETEMLREQLRQDREDRQAETARQRRKERQDERRERRARWRKAAPDTTLNALWAALIVAPLLLAWDAQARFAATVLHVPAGMSWLFPLAIEAGAWVCAFEAHRRASRGAPVGSLLRWMWVLAGIAAAINTAHGTADYGIVAGLALGTLSVLGVLLHHIRQSLNAAEAEGTSAREVSQRFTRWLHFPRMSLTAARIATRAGLDHTAAWKAAWIDRHGVGPAASKRDRRLAGVIVKRQAKADRKAAENGEFVIVNGVILRATLPPLDALVRQVPAVEIAEVSTPIEQRKLSPRASALLAKTQAAIQAGELPERPSANAIRKRFGGAMETAQEVRDHMNHMHPVTTESEAA